MSTSLITALGLVVVAAITAYGTWRIAKRNTSGTIDTSEAATLWDEGTLMRGELRVELSETKTLLATSNEKLSEAITAITTLNTEIQRSRQETEASREETRLSREETRVLMAQIQELKGSMEDIHTEVKTSNDLTIGALADNTETRRILLIPVGERTEQEVQHVATAGERLPVEKRPVDPNEEGNANG